MKPYKDPEVLKQFIQRIYQAVMAPDSIYDVMSDLRSVIDAQFSAFQIEDVITHELGRSFLIDYDDKAIDAYSEYYISRDPWTLAGLENGLLNQSFIAAQRHVSDKVYRETEFYRDWGQYHGVRHAIGCSFDIDDGSMLKISFQRGSDQPPFDQDAETFLNFLHPHFKQFVRLSPMFEEVVLKYSHWQKSLEYLDRPIWVVNADLKIEFMNSQAEQWLEGGKYLNCVQKTLCAANVLEQEKLHLCVKNMSNISVSSIISDSNVSAKNERVILGTESGNESFWITPFINNTKQNLVMITGRKALPETAIIMQRHSLTQRQSQLCMLLVQGCSIQEVAAQLNIAVNTARNTLAACFRVLNVSNQSELIRTLLGDVVVNKNK
ncbi:MAG: helix-turn-helix transcriptional regulator [Oleispira sp.]